MATTSLLTWTRGLLLAGAVTGAAMPTQANVSYHYDAPISYWADAGGRSSWALYAGLDSHITLDFTLADALGSNWGAPVGPVWHNIASADILNWSYHGGGPSLNIGSNVSGSTLNIGVVTDGSGQIVNAGFYVSGPVTLPNLPAPDYWGNTTFLSALTSSHGGGYDQQSLTSDYARYYGYFNGPLVGSLYEIMHTPVNGGTWIMTQDLQMTSAVPEPQTYALMLAGLGLVLAAARRTRRKHWAVLSALGVAALTPLAAGATQLMQATVTGTISSGGDAYRNSVYFGSTAVNNLVGQTASVSIVYDADLFRPNYPGFAPNWTFTHQPNYPSFLGTAGQSPVQSGSFTVNGFTLPMDVSGAFEVARLTVENPTYSPIYGQNDSWGLSGGDTRFTWCPNDGQCAEAVQLFASQTYTASDLFGGQHNFDPADALVAQAIPYRSIGAYVRLMSVTSCPGAICAAERFNDNAVHWVEFYVNGTSLTVSPVSAVPEPDTYALLLFGLGVVGTLSRRRRAALHAG